MRAGGGLGVVLHGERRDVEGAEPLDHLVVQSDVAHFDAAVAVRAVELALDGRVEITAHNHGFAVQAPLDGSFDSPNGYGRIEVSHVGLNDRVVEGLRALDIPAFSVQYHPEAAAGPHDANYLFDRFRDLVVATLENKKNA